MNGLGRGTDWKEDFGLEFIFLEGWTGFVLPHMRRWAAKTTHTFMKTTLLPLPRADIDGLMNALFLLEQLDSSGPINSPTVLTVFRLYCVREMSVAQVARACRCSVGTVSNRLKLLRARTGVEPRKLRRS